MASFFKKGNIGRLWTKNKKTGHGPISSQKQHEKGWKTLTKRKD
jgi:hypothetical protein